MRKLTFARSRAIFTVCRTISMICLLVLAVNSYAWSQCTPQSNTISGTVFQDTGNDGAFALSESGASGILVSAVNASGVVVDTDITNGSGVYTLTNVVDGEAYRVEFQLAGNYHPGALGVDNKSSIQFVTAPACAVNYGVTDEISQCGDNPALLLSCFVQGEVTERPDFATLISVEHDFKTTSAVSVIATNGQTGSVWGIAQDVINQNLFSAAMVKQYGGLKYGPYAILKTELTGAKSTSLFVDVSTIIPQVLPGLGVTDVKDCAYGNQVGRVGLGNMIMTADSRTLYTTVLDQNLVVGIDAIAPTADNTRVFEMPRPAGIDPAEEYRIFALEMHKGLIYVGGTVTASVSKNKNNSMAVVMTLDPQTGATNEVFRNTYLKGFWQDEKPASLAVNQWFTDISFTDQGEMVISLSDRVGHRYCKASTNRLDQQFPDILLAGYNATSGMWELEQNGQINGRSGSGVGNGEGPGGGEFFGFDNWPTNPTYHNETAIGSAFVLPGSGEVVVAVYDPLINSYSGGLHRYSTLNGSKTGAIELYSHQIYPVFGKATGFGDIIALCQAKTVEIGNYVWLDADASGTQDAGEPGISGVALNLYDEACTLIGTTTTDANGYYSFNDSNVDANQDGTFDGVFANATYYIEINPTAYDESTGLYTVGNNEYTICIADAGGNANDLIDCDATEIEAACLDGSIIEVNVKENNHSFDIAFTNPAGFDLALIKEVLGAPFAIAGENIDFRITVYNQGGVSASSVTVTDYLADGYVFVQEDNPTWTKTGDKLTTVFNQRLLPGSSVSKLLTLQVGFQSQASYINVAEISESLDLNGDPALDEDSTADDIYNNDNGGLVFSPTDDQINDNGDTDEDDHDPAVPRVFDLAARVVIDEDICYYAGDLVQFNVTVYNQGNTEAGRVKLVQYFSSDLVFNKDLSVGWYADGDNVATLDENILAVGETRHYSLYFNVAMGNQTKEIISWVEIAESSPVNSDDSFDFDSTPDDINGNDNGGQAFSSTDNEIEDHGAIDEDDHDPVVVKTQYVDLALMKTAARKRVKAGENVTFDIEIINQGDAAAKTITIVDYIPEGMSLADNNWTLSSAGYATRKLELEEELTKGNKITTHITLKVGDGLAAGELVNYAEILEVTDYNNRQIGSIDIDSSPDDNKTNDSGGIPDSDTDNTVDTERSIDEDDHDPARIVIVESGLVNSECLANATNSSNGQYEDVFKVTGGTGDGWYVFDANNYFDSSSPDPGEGPLVPLATGPTALLDEMYMGNGLSMYTITVIREDGDDGFIVLRSNDDDIETLQIPAESYEDLVISGDQALCNGGTEQYCVTNADPTLQYMWEASAAAGAIITPITANASCVEINWDAAPVNAEYQVTVAADDGCIAPALFLVQIGSASGAMSCIGNMNLSLDADCEVTIRPPLVLTSEILPGQAYSVMLTTQSGEVIPNATLTSAHIGMTVTAKVIDGCNGNSCWSEIFVEDKLKPVIECVDTEIACNKVDEFSGPFASDNCGNPVTVELLNQTVNVLSCDDYVAEIVSTYQAIDASGNKSEICEMSLLVERVDLGDIEFPADFLMMDNTALNCDQYDLDMDGIADLDVTGRPEYNNEIVFPDFGQLCNTAITFEDKKRVINGVIKITRTWTAWEWYCSETEIREHKQYIEIRDIEDPIIDCPADITVSAVSGNCAGTVVLPELTVTDECTPDQVTYTIKPSFTGLIKEGDSRVVTFPYEGSPHTVTYTATDAAGNTAVCDITVTVQDNIAPVAICDQNTVVGLNGLGIAYAYALNIDDGSYDACGLDKIEIRRMDIGGPFGDRVLFGCDDVGEIVVVELQATDIAGLTNTCMANVIVQDKQAPVVTGPANQVIECGTSFSPLSQFGDFTFTDACEVTTTMDSTINLNSCGTGTIIRTFTASDRTGSSTATQIIEVVNNDPFDEDDITLWPADFDLTINTCDVDGLTHPDNLPAGFGYPEYNDDACDMVASAFHDEIFTLFNDPSSVCYQILRTWTVIDWCQRDINGVPLEFTSVQIISVTNTVEPDPIVITPLLDTITSSLCDSAMVTFTAMSGDCNDDLLQSLIQIDYDSDFLTTGTYDLTIGGAGASTTFSQMLPQGNHTVVVTFLNPCNNMSTTSFPLVINNDVAPNILCQQTTISVQPWDLDGDGEPDTEAACIDVNSLVIPSGTFHLCDVDFDLSFSPDAIVSELCFDCNDLGINSVTIYAIDVNGNVSSCIDTVTVLDNNDTDICLDVKDCVSVLADTTLTIVQNCAVTVSNADLDVVAVLTDCGPLTITHNYTSAPSNTTLEGASFPLGMTTVTWTIGNGVMLETCDLVVTVIDEIDPVLTCAADLTVGTSSIDGCSFTPIGTSLDPTATDNCSVSSVTHDYTSAPDNTSLSQATFPIGTTIVIFTATDGSGNTATCQTAITVEDDQSPSLVCAEDGSFTDTDDGDQSCSHTLMGTGLDPVTVQDACSDITMLVHDYVTAPSNTTLSGATFPLGATVVTFTATDGAGNTATCQVTVTVTDNVAPTIICAPDLAVAEDTDGVTDCEYTNTGTILDPVASADNCGPAGITLTHDYFGTTDNTTLDGAEFPVGISVVIWTATDAAGNTATCDVEVTVIDNVAPECVDQGVITVNVGGDESLVITTDLLTIQYSDACGIDTVTFDPPMLDCDPAGMVTVTATVTDVNGNTIDCPIQFNVVANVDISCSLNVDTLYLDNNGMLTIDPEDVVIINGGGCGIVYTPLLDQTMFDCDDAQEDNITLVISVESGGVIEECGTALIVVADTIPPAITCVADQSVEETTDGANDCQFTVMGTDLDPTVVEACGPVTVVNDFNNTATLDGAVFPVGDPTTINWTVTDASGNVSTCTYSFTVTDETPPTCVDQGIIDVTVLAGEVITITDALLTTPFTDNCAVANTTYNPATIDCMNGGTFNVTATVTDVNGNSIDCQIVFNVIVNDNLSCSFNIDTAYLDVDGLFTLDPNVIVDVVGGSCGGTPLITLDQTFASCNDVALNPFNVTIFADGMICGMDSIVVLDTIPPSIECSNAMISCTDFDTNFEGDVDAYLETVPTNDNVMDNCESTLQLDTLTDITGLNACNYGVILRTLIAFDPLSGETDSCTQEITINGPANPITQEEIDGILQDTVVINDCMNGSANVTEITEGDLEDLVDCGQFSLFFSDESAGMGCPDTITRTYTITAVCQDMTFSSTQIIILNDDEAPIVSMIADTTITVNPENCLAIFDLGGMVSGTDNCTDDDDLTFTYQYEGSGIIDIDAQNPIEFGEYNVTVTTTDDCGNIGTEEFLLSVIDTSDIIVSCDKIIAFIDPVTLMNDIQPIDGIMIFQNCEMTELIFTYTAGDFTDTTRIVDCDNVPILTVYDVFAYEVTAAGDTIPFDINPDVPGVDSLCKIQVELRDTLNLCGNNLLGIGGQVQTVTGEGIPGFEMTLFGSGEAPVMSGYEGEYTFPMMPIGGNYGIGTYKNDDVMNGVTTLDLIMIQRHILGLAEFDSPHQYIAADINNSESVNGSDLLALRKMILGINSEFPNNQSWRAIDVEHVFDDATDPWSSPIPEGYDIMNLSTNMYIDFLGIKIGDINGSASPNVQAAAVSSTRSSMTMILDHDRNGSTASFTESSELAGMQFAIATGGARIARISSTIFDENQIGYFEVRDGIYNVSIANATPITVAAGLELFVIEYDCIDCNAIPVQVYSKDLRPELYLEQSLQAVPLMIEVRSQVIGDSFVVSQNTPNPWDAVTSIDVKVAKDTETQMTIVDMTGRVVYQQVYRLHGGNNTIQIDNTIVPGAGVYYYELSSGENRAQHKMIKLK